MKNFLLILFLCYLPIPGIHAQDGTISTVTFQGPITQQNVRFKIFLPDGYDQNNQNYPVIYFLHGSLVNPSFWSLQVGFIFEYYEDWIENGDIDDIILVSPYGEEGVWADSYDGGMPNETKAIQEVIPYVDSVYRTISNRQNRMLIGLSAGGHGVMAFLIKYPELFSSALSLDGGFFSFQECINLHPEHSAFFNHDESYYDQFNPLMLANANAGSLIDSCCIRIVSAEFIGENLNFSARLNGLGVGHEFLQVDCPHWDLDCIVQEEGLNTFTFFNECRDSLMVSTAHEPNVHFDLYPNPASELLILDLIDSQVEIIDILIVDLSGKRVLNIPSNNYGKTAINILSLKQGIYFLRIRTDLGAFAKKIVVLN
jgi:esterase/lipase superfamily enzyme